MPIEQQVCSLELANKLKELGAKQESCFWWVNTAGFTTEWQLMDTAETDFSSFETKGISWREVGNPVSAFTVAELGEIMKNGEVSSGIHKDDGAWCKSGILEHFSINTAIKSMKTEADARAMVLIYLLENKLITL